MAKKPKPDERDADDLLEEIAGLRTIAEALGVEDVDAALDDIAYRRDGSPVWLGAPETPPEPPGGGESGSEGEGGETPPGEPSGDPGASEGDQGETGGGARRGGARRGGLLRGTGRTGGAGKPVADMSQAEKVAAYRREVGKEDANA